MAHSIITERNDEKYEHDGFLYVKDRMSTDGITMFWRCENRCFILPGLNFCFALNNQ